MTWQRPVTPESARKELSERAAYEAVSGPVLAKLARAWFKASSAKGRAIARAKMIEALERLEKLFP